MTELTKNIILFVVLLALVVVYFFLPPQVSAAPNCAPHKKMMEYLSKKFLELPVGVGIVNNNRVVEMFLSEKGSWTIIVTPPNGLSCVLAGGNGWEDVPADFQSLEPRT